MSLQLSLGETRVSRNPQHMERDFDLILQGATGFTGRLATAELAQFAPAGLRWAISGRNPVRLQQLADQYEVPFQVANGLNQTEVHELAQASRVILSCAGPFAKFGDRLVDACVAEQTHYADLTGELPWISNLVRRHHQTATNQGTTLIPASGFDSVPTDLAVLQLVRKLQANDQQPGACLGAYRIRGGLNGGTLASALELYENASAPLDQPSSARGPHTFHIPQINRWATPFLMAPVNEWVVQRSAKLLAERSAGYGLDFEYREVLAVRSRWKASISAMGLGLADAMLRRSWGRKLAGKFGPKPGQGPNAELRKNGFVKLSVLAKDLDQSAELRMSGDPGNTVTVRCLVQTGLALAAGEAQQAGVVTPASALGDSLMQRLKLRGDLLEFRP
jgi:short subunit dehydrogenase-like uncharacterized protein